jgi:glucose/arabinose dehydrogenase
MLNHALRGLVGPIALGAISLSLLASACGESDDDSSGAGPRGGSAGGGAKGGSSGKAGKAGSAGRGSGGASGSAGMPSPGAGGSSAAGSGGSSAAGRGGSSIGSSGETGAAGDSTGGVGGSATGGTGGTQDAGVGGNAGAGEGGRGGEGGQGGDGEVGVFRPERRDPTPERIAGLSVAPGFVINAFATGLGNPRMLATYAGHVYVTRPETGDVLQLTDTNADGVADTVVTVAQGLANVHGIAFDNDLVYLATIDQVLHADVLPDGTFFDFHSIIDALPDGGEHYRRTVGIGPDSLLYVSVGSTCNACAEPDPEHATILRAALDGSAREVFAAGLRNTMGFGWHPVTGELWGMDHGSDLRGDDVPPDELNRLEQGNDYGWPYCYGNRQVDPLIGDPVGTTQALYCETTAPSVLDVQAHSAPIGLTFYSGTTFPSGYQDDAFVAFHGSWNRSEPVGYRVARLRFEAGSPVAFEDFVSGFLIEGGAAYFGRPAGVATGPDGSLLFTDDVNGVLYRVAVAP